MSAIKLLSLLIVMTFLETANFIHVPTRAESFEHNGVLLALKYNKAANEYVSNLKDKPSSKSTSEAAWDFAQAAADYLNYTQNKDNLRKNDFLKNPNPLTNSKELETVIEQTKIKGVAKPSNTVTIIVPAKNSESKSQYPSLNAIFNQNMAQYYLQKKHSKTAPAKADKEAKKVKGANKEKILLLKAKRPVSKAASFNKQAMMSTQREALKINNNLTPVLRLQMSYNHPKPTQNHHQRVQNPTTLSHQIKPLSANSPRMSSAPLFSQHQHQQHQQKAHHQQQQHQNPLQNSHRTLHPSQTHRPSSSQVAQTPVLSYSTAPYLVQTPQPLYYQPSRPVTNLWPNLFNVPHFNIGDILERGRSTKLKENSETAEEKTKTLQAVTTQIGEDEEDEDEDEEDEAEIEEENEDNEEDEENATDVEEPDEAEDNVEDDNEDTDDDSFINPIVHQLSMQRPPFFAAAPRLANHYENEFEIPAPQNLNDFVPLRPSIQSNEDNIENARKRLHQIRQHLTDSQLNNNPISVSSPNLVTGQLNRPFLNQLNNENQRLVNVPRRAGSIHQLKLTKPINDEDEKEDEKENEKEAEKEDQDQDSQEDKDENVDSEDESESKSSEPEPKSSLLTSTNDQKENVDNEEESEKSEEDPKSSTSTDDSSKDDVESLDDELNKCLSDLEGNDSTEKSSSSKVTFSNLETCLKRLYSPEKESQESKNEDENKESESNDDVDEKLPLLL